MEPASEGLKVKFSPLDGPSLVEIQSDFPNYVDGLSRAEPGGFLLTPSYAENANRIYSFQVQPDDHWVVTFPKSGTTWVQEIVWVIANDFDFETAKSTNINARFPFFEYPFVPPGRSIEQQLSHFDKVASLHPPRFYKSHLPFYLLPSNILETCKVVYVARNPKDVIVSYFHHHKLIKIHHFTKGIEEFAEYFMKDEVMFAPYFAHVIEAWNMRNHPNLLFLFYEDLKADLAGQVRRIATFLNKEMNEGHLKELLEHVRFENFSRNENVNKEKAKETGDFNPDGNFIRKGKTGDWKNYFSQELNARIDEWIEKNLEGTTLKFVTELEKQD